MAKRQIKKAIAYLRNLLEKKGLQVDKIILFGSHAKGNYRKDSDIDVVIISKDFTGKGIFEKSRMLGDVEWLLMEKFLIPLDIIAMSPEDFRRGLSPVSQYAKEGEILHG